MISIKQFLIVACIAVSGLSLYSCKESNENVSENETAIDESDSINNESKNENEKEEGINRPSNLRPVPENPFLDSTKYKVGKPKSIKLGL